ncbi:MAG: SPOR domain-containing protein [Bacteroidales bacterium]|nr:SPOR domain-containing protein [Bacteroidales bacterium]
MKGIFGLVIFVFLGLSIFGQNRESHVQVIQDPRVDTLLAKHRYLNQNKPGIEGWRIQIFFESGNYSKRLAIEAKSAFVEKYPDIPAYVIFHEPYYKVRIGDYRTRMQAEKFLKQIEQEYPNAFVVNDEINFPKLD